MDLQVKWTENNDAYRTKEIGSGVQSFVKDVLRELLHLTEIPVKKSNVYKSTLNTTPEECTSYLHGHGNLKSRIVAYTLQVIIVGS
jgi:hypothetical protein